MRSRIVLILTVLGLLMAVAAPVAGGVQPVTVEKIGPPTVVAGGTLTYTITVVNTDPNADVLLVVVTDVIPLGTAFQSATVTTGSAVLNVDVLTWTMTSLAPSTAATMNVTLGTDPSLPAGTIITNVASLGQLSATVSTTVVAAPPTPVASNLPNAALPESGPSSPLATLGFAVLLIGALGTLAVVSGRRAARGR